MIHSEQNFPWRFAIGVLLLATLVVIVVCGFCKIGVCGYDYEVSVTSLSATPIMNVRGKAFDDFARAREIAANPKMQLSMPRDDEATAFDGKSLRVEGLYTCSSYCLDLVHTGSPPRYVVLLVDYKDGKRENSLVEMPKESGTQRIAVEVP